MSSRKQARLEAKQFIDTLSVQPYPLLALVIPPLLPLAPRPRLPRHSLCPALFLSSLYYILECYVRINV